MLKKKRFHFSVDDVFSALIEISDNNILLKNHWFFKPLYILWKKYRIKTGLHLFYEGMIDGKLRNLKEIKKLNKNQFKDWLYIGPHGLNKETPPHLQSPNEQKKCFKKIINEINLFAGSKNY